jgi:aspartate racemase
MAQKPLYIVVAVVGIAAASGGAWWYQNQPAAPASGQTQVAGLFGGQGGDLGPEVREGMAALAEALVAEGAEAVIAGCTEAPLVLDPADVRVPMIDAGEELARRCVSVCLGLEPLPQGR